MKLQKGGPKHDGFIRLCRIIIRGTGSTTYYFDMYDENDNKIVDNAVAWPYSSNQTSAPIPLPYGNYFGLTGYKNTITTVVKNDYIFYSFSTKGTGAAQNKLRGDGYYWNYNDNKIYQMCPLEYWVFGYYNDTYWPQSIIDIQPFEK